MFTEEEINWLANVFRTPQLRPDPLDPRAVETTLRIQSIIGKMKEIYESSQPKSGPASVTDKHHKLNGDGKAKAKRSMRSAVPK